jgi:hypothetical protein
VSDAPSYHSTMPTNETVPAYSPPTPRNNTSTPTPTSNPSSMLPSGMNVARGVGLPRIPDPPRRSQLPQLSEFRIPTWSSLNSNPNARHYQAVARRRVSAATTNNSVQMHGTLRTMLDRLNEEDDKAPRVRPLEDPYLVGEEAAARARRERLARENTDVLVSEDRRWDWFLGKCGVDIPPCATTNLVISSPWLCGQRQPQMAHVKCYTSPLMI